LKKNRVLVLSGDKSGEFLVSNIIEELGYHNANVVLREFYYIDYNPPKSMSFKRSTPHDLIDAVDIYETVDMVPNDTVILAQVPYEDNYRYYFDAFKVIILEREVENSKKDMITWKQDYNSEYNIEASLKRTEKILKWKEKINHFYLKYEELENEETRYEVIDSLQKYLFEEVKHSSKKVYEKAEKRERIY